MFFAGRQLPHLKQLTVEVGMDDSHSTWCLRGQDLRKLATCCTALEQLVLNEVVRGAADVSGLVKLPASCTSLMVSGRAFKDAAVPALRQLTQLQALWFHFPAELSDVGLQQLTALTGLTRLVMNDCAGFISRSVIITLL